MLDNAFLNNYTYIDTLMEEDSPYALLVQNNKTKHCVLVNEKCEIITPKQSAKYLCRQKPYIVSVGEGNEKAFVVGPRNIYELYPSKEVLTHNISTDFNSTGLLETRYIGNEKHFTPPSSNKAIKNPNLYCTFLEMLNFTEDVEALNYVDFKLCSDREMLGDMNNAFKSFLKNACIIKKAIPEEPSLASEFIKSQTVEYTHKIKDKLLCCADYKKLAVREQNINNRLEEIEAAEGRVIDKEATFIETLNLITSLP